MVLDVCDVGVVVGCSPVVGDGGFGGLVGWCGGEYGVGWSILGGGDVWLVVGVGDVEGKGVAFVSNAGDEPKFTDGESELEGVCFVGVCGVLVLL